MSFRFRMLITVSMLIAITFGIGGTILITVSFNNSLEDETDSAFDSFESVQNMLLLINSLGEQTDFNGLSDALAQTEERNTAFWQAISLQSSEISVYKSGVKALENYDLGIPDTDKCAYITVADEHGNGIIVASSIPAGDDVLVLKARFDLSSVYTARDANIELFGVIYATVVIASAAVSAALSVLMTARLRRLTAAVRKISGGDLSMRSRLVSKDEFGQLSRDIDAMADKLQENIVRLETDMERQEAFMGAFAHELKTPMASIIGYADLLRQDGLDDSTRLVAANYIFSEGKRLDKLSFKLLDMLLLKRDKLTFKQVNLFVFLSEVERALAPVLLEKGIRLACKGERGRVSFEPDLVKSLLYNLVDNAAKAIDGEGVIAVKGTVINGGCIFEVADNGCGMEKNELARITEAFYRVDRSRSRKLGGAGLGLALCKEIVEGHRGSMSFISEPGVGTKVTVALYGGVEGNEQN